MATEIELKAHVHNSEELKLLLSKKAEYLYAFEKRDNYWFAEKPGLPPSGLRIRTEKRCFPDGNEESLTMATYKVKEVRDGIEINDEREFSVEPAFVLEDFLKLLGLKPVRSKEKRGWAFSKNGLTAELAEVKGLGWFVELEIIVTAEGDTVHAGNTDGIFAQEKKRLLDFLDSLGITREAIESRFYSEMLAEAANR